MPLPFNNEQIVGTCGLCEAPVVLPIAWWGVIPPVPTCKNCGATERQDYGPTLPMNPPNKVWTSNKIEIDPSSPYRMGGSVECSVR